MKIIKARPALFWFGFLMNILPLNLCLINALTIDQASALMDAIWIPSILIMLISLDFPKLALLSILKVTGISIGQKFYPFYIGINLPIAIMGVFLIFALIISVISYIQPRFLRQCTLP